jgi:signal transduction histidine kinase/CheY-like chemotaxis protein/HPt (histidine-containing phosphotransfer) domain-containing protein
MNLKKIISENFKQLLFVFLAFALMVLVSFFFVSNIVEKQVRSNAEEVFHVAENRIRSNIREAEVVLLSAVESVRYVLDGGQSLQDIRAYIKGLTSWLVKPENNISGLSDIRAYIKGEYIDGMDWDPPANYIPWERPWYIDALTAEDSITRSEPYTDPRSGSLIIAMSKTIKNSRGDVYGVLAVPIDMNVIAGEVKKLQFAEGGYGMLLNQSFVFLVHPNEKYLSKSLGSISDDYAKIARNLLAGNDTISSGRATNIDGAGVVISFRRIFTGWYIGIATPVSSYYYTAYLMAVVLTLLGLIFMSILSFFLIRLSMAKHHSDDENKSKSSFLARMSHEIRTPMNSILGMTELLLRKNISPETNDYLSVISQAGQTLLAIINDILDFSRITSGSFRIESRKYQLSSIINDTISVIRMRIIDKSLDFLVSVDNSIPAQLIGDDIRIRQILINLLNNAIKYTPKGYIALDIRRGNMDEHGVKLVLSVSDSGIGIKTEDMNRLFSDFTRLDMNKNQHIEGTGLGLAITYTLCQAMGGGISVSSEYGKGSTFTATIPQSFESDKKLALIDEPEKRRILFFEDRPLVFDSIIYSFINLGLKPFCVRDFQDFSEKLAESKYEFAFVSSRHAPECLHILGKAGSLTQLVILVELGEVSFFREVKSIMMPVYCLPIANVINNINDEESNKTLRFRFGFSAPSAKILIVDDISSNLRVAKELMAPYKMEVHTCLSGSEAVKLVQENRYDIVFMDHMMPGMDGLEATAAIRALGAGDEYYKNLPIIALTANAIAEQRELFLQRKMNDFIAKPIEVKQLNAVLEHWIPHEKKIIAEIEEHEEPGQTLDLRIPGIDTKMGLLGVNSSLNVYLDILDEFCRNVEDITIQIRRAEKEDSTVLYANSMHALKGISRSIGALELGDFAEQMEKAAKSGDSETLKQRTKDLFRDIMVITNNIHTVIAAPHPDSDSSKEIDISLLHLDVLHQAITGLDIDAVNKMLLEYLSIPMNSNVKDNIDKIERHILMFEYDQALEIIDQMLHQ